MVNLLQSDDEDFTEDSKEQNEEKEQENPNLEPAKKKPNCKLRMQLEFFGKINRSYFISRHYYNIRR